MSKDPFVFVHHIVDAISDIEKYRKDTVNLKEFKVDTKTQDAITRKLEIIGEAVNNLSRDFLEKYSEVDWRGPIGLRNVISHEYFELSLSTIWKLLDRDLPILKSQMLKILEDEM